jgi:hypothetical protein
MFQKRVGTAQVAIHSGHAYKYAPQLQKVTASRGDKSRYIETGMFTGGVPDSLKSR